MFTGLVETTGTIVRRSDSKLLIRPKVPVENPERGESIAVNGCCLTLESASADGVLTFHTLAETLRRTNIAGLPVGGTVNLERALMVGKRLGGHFVQGHVDTVGRIAALQRLADGDMELAVTYPPEFDRETVIKGGIAIDGVSLTIAAVKSGWLSVRLIPETLAVTALQFRSAGSEVNLEFDILGKYIIRQLELSRGESPAAGGGTDGNITLDRLRQAGFLD